MQKKSIIVDLTDVKQIEFPTVFDTSDQKNQLEVLSEAILQSRKNL
ncbi:hypothetical protein [Tepidibacillus fermentans]|nr:hypothetical protein [Tepidibacillus fermentans]